MTKITIYSDKDCKLWYVPLGAPDWILFENQESAIELLNPQKWPLHLGEVEIDGTIKIVEQLEKIGPYPSIKVARIVPSKPKEEPKTEVLYGEKAVEQIRNQFAVRFAKYCFVTDQEGTFDKLLETYEESLKNLIAPTAELEIEVDTYLVKLPRKDSITAQKIYDRWYPKSRTWNHRPITSTVLKMMEEYAQIVLEEYKQSLK